ncbi:MAG TPA: GNAT family N-acetyltransferase [Flavobacterium sp.]|nr:GNAT family N-acetyltransferase [Flavobacterium sp.]
MSITVTDAEIKDVLGIRKVFYETWLVTYPNEELGITRDDIEDRYKDAFTKEKLKKQEDQIKNLPANQKLLVAKDADKVVGVCRIIKHEDKNQLQAIYVLPQYQGKGIGKMFWNEALRFFDKDKPTFVEVATYNTKAIEFYKKLGFSDTGKRIHDENFRMKSGNILPEMEMSLKL